MRILVDMDGVIADFDTEFLQRWCARYPDKPSIPLAERKAFYVKDDYPEELKPLVVEILAEPDFFKEMSLVRGAREALHEMEANGFEVFLCSSPFNAYHNCVLEKYMWVEKYIGADWVRKIILTKDKTLVKADYLIDDKPVISGVEDHPSWEHILYDRPYNRHILKRRVTWENWREIILPSVRV